jgi:protein-S-isoprenylcysteine O-methyltransferase Ste14
MLAAAWVLVVLFPLSEIALGVFKRSRSGSAARQDRGSMRLLWVVIAASVTAALLTQGVALTHMHVAARGRLTVAVGLLAAGLTVRWVAVLTLGRFFTVDVAVHRDHSLVQSGLYRLVRHPSYTGLLIALGGLGVFFGNWLGLALLLVPTTLALARRIAVEEAALEDALGADYSEYCKRTKRLLPWVY